ncbi:H-NS family nucleoid-associated regulatory protein [Aeromonas caviae]|uniref:H-NS family histone-like protein n=1 Tax=Aeromonas caviae TaxID=648 RepID=UPI00313D4CCE
MNEFLKTLLKIRSLRAALRDLSFEQLEEVKDKFDQVHAELSAATEKERAAQEEHQRKLVEFSEMLKAAGIDPRDLVGNAATSTSAEKGKGKGKRAPRPPKYKYQEDGQEKTWTGQGRMPKAIAEQIEQGKSLEQFAI